MTIDIFVLRVAVALVLGLVLGLDREAKNAPVGVRTFALVSMGAAAYTMLTLQLGEIAAERVDLVVDPSRLIQGLIGGIGFLGAGAIIGSRSEHRVRGIATGAAIWVAGALGVSCGLGLYWWAAAVTGMALALLLVSEYAEAKFGKRDDVVRNADDEEGGDGG